MTAIVPDCPKGHSPNDLVKRLDSETMAALIVDRADWVTVQCSGFERDKHGAMEPDACADEPHGAVLTPDYFAEWLAVWEASAP